MTLRRVPAVYLVAWVAAALLPVPVLLLEPASPARTVATVLLLLFLPGYALLAALYPRQQAMLLTQRLVLAAGFSLVIDMLLALALNFSVLGVRLPSILGATTAVSLTLLTTAIVRCLLHRDEADEADAAAPGEIDTTSDAGAPSEAEPGANSSVTYSRWFRPALAAAVIALFGATVASALTRESPQTFSEFYLQGVDGTLTGLNLRATPNGAYTVRTAVRNREDRPMRYRIIAHSGRGTLWSGQPFTLQPDQEHSELISFAAGTGLEELITYDLLAGEPEAPYRRLTTWVNYRPGTPATGTPTLPAPAITTPSPTIPPPGATPTAQPQ